MRYLLRTTLKASAAMFLAMAPAQADPIWAMQADASTLEFVVEIGGTESTGQFDDWSTTIRFDPDMPDSAKLRVEIGMGSVSIADPRAQAAPSAAWLAVNNHPMAVFEATGFEWSKVTGALTVNGTLTLRGIAQPLTLTGTLKIDGTRGEADVSATILRLPHRIGVGQDAVGAEVLLRARVVAFLEN